MASYLKTIELRVVGYVSDPTGAATDKSGQGISEIVINPDLAECLDGVEEYSHIVVLFWLDRLRAEEREVKRQRPHQGRGDLPEVGVFALRCPARPNPIGLTAAEVVAREGNRLRVRGLDALDGSPVIDIKPYSIRNDLVANSRRPAYATQLWDKVHQEPK